MMTDYKEEARKELARRELNKRQKTQPGWLEKNANFAEENINKPIESLGRSARDIAGGYVQGLGNIAPGLYNLGASGANALGANVPKSSMFDVVPHSPSATAGEIGSFFSAPGFLKSISKIPELVNTVKHATKIPMIADSIKHASNILGKSPTATRIAGNAILGGAYTPDNPLVGLGLGAAGGAAGELASKGYNSTKNALQNSQFIKKFNPAAHAKELEHHLSGGANNITENSRQLANDIRNAHKMREEEAQIFYNHALKNAGHESIYGVGPKDIIPSRAPGYAKQQSLNDKIKDLNVGDTFDAFKSNPSFDNAHKLQSQLGFMERDLKSNLVKPPDYRIQLNKIESARNELKENINQFLEKRDLSTNNPIGHHYQKGNELFHTNVAPYLSHNKLIDIVKGGQTAVKDLHKVFDSPSNTITKEGIEKIGSINKIMHDLPENSKMRILFDAIGGNKLSPEALLKKLDEIKRKGFESYFTPEIEESINALGQKLKNRKRLKIGLGVTGAYGGAKAANSVINHILQ